MSQPVAPQPKETYHPMATYDVASNATWNDRYSKLWIVAAACSVIGFIALCTTATILGISLLSSVSLPVMGLIFFSGAFPLAFETFNYCKARSRAYAKQAQEDGALLKMRNLSPKAVETLLTKFNLTEKVKDAEITKNLLGYYKYYENKAKEKKLEADKTYQPQNLNEKIEVIVDGKSKKLVPAQWQIDAIDFTKPKQRATAQAIHTQKIRRENLLDQAAWARTYSALCLALIEDLSAKKLEESISLISAPYEIRLISDKEQIPDSFAIVKNNTTKRMYTRNEIEALSIRSLAEIFFGLEEEFFDLEEA